jgi:hypothetical protein
MNQERLQQMVTMLRGLPPKPEVEFRLWSWNCGTSACAVGHACMDPFFQDQGLQMSVNGAPRFGGESSWAAVRLFFDLDAMSAEYLFSYEAYENGGSATAEEVSDRIESFLKEAEVTA